MDYTYKHIQLKSGRMIKVPVSCELSPGEQLVLIKENLGRVRKFFLDQMVTIAQKNVGYDIR